MKINSIDEYGLRILIQIAKAPEREGLSISQLSELEGLSTPYVAKLTRVLKASGLINSTRGHKGGYVLALPAHQITVKLALRALGGALYDNSFCKGHSGDRKFCTNSVDCSLRSLWSVVQEAVDQILDQVTLADLMGSEQNSVNRLKTLMEEIFPDQQ
jgi:Rrf2 family transcriptional regulator, iron-sulfur cluster assembly transcription factor